MEEIFKENIFFSVFLVYDPLIWRTTRLFLAFMDFFLELFFVGMLIDRDITENNQNFFESSKNYKFTEFLITAYLFLISFVVVLIILVCAKLSL